MRAVAVIPARFGSTRFPGKPLADIKGKSLIERVFNQVRKSKLLHDVIIATDDVRIVNAAKKFGARVVLTSKGCKSGTDRLTEIAKKVEKTADVLINVQGDEPLISPALIDELVRMLRKHRHIDVVTAAYPIKNRISLHDINTVKVVLDPRSDALYFSRLPIPFNRDGKGIKSLKHIGIYGYRRNFLLRFSAWKQTPLEKTEKLEQLRILENGHTIKVVIAKEDSFGVDVPEDIKKIERLLP